MAEEISKIISNGIETYTKNLNLCVPFVLYVFISWIFAAIMLIIGFLLLFGTDISDLNVDEPEALFLSIASIASQHIPEIALLIISTFLIIMLIFAFFESGAIGMARQAIETGRTQVSTMIEAGRKNFVNLFLADLLVLLVALAGIVFIVPGIKNFDLDQPSASAGILLGGGFLLWMVYLLIIGAALAAFRYALVIGSLGPVDGILAGIDFFKKNWVDVIILILLTIAVSIVFAIIDMVMNFIPIISIVWSFISLIITFGVLQPIMTVWWVRLYMTRTGKQVYVNDLLAHPNDLQDH
ncbi:MAG: hypothetical protein L6282_05135 [Candidatus Methanoperedenaceae archaeon]|nr:hypothetical protein [Candidatus Methanoperedenaceae archaeon]